MTEVFVGWTLSFVGGGGELSGEEFTNWIVFVFPF